MIIENLISMYILVVTGSDRLIATVKQSGYFGIPLLLNYLINIITLSNCFYISV